MILLLNTSTPECKLTLIDGSFRYDDTWDAQRTLAKDILLYLHTRLQMNGKSFDDLTGLVVYKGPGSFTGLRISITVLNTLAYTDSLPIVGMTGEDWQEAGLKRLEAGETDVLVMPEYGGEANITQPRK